MDRNECDEAYIQLHDEFTGATSCTKNCYVSVWRMRQNLLSQFSPVSPPARKTWPAVQAVQIQQSFMASCSCCYHIVITRVHDFHGLLNSA